MLQIENIMRPKVYFAEGASTTKAGLQSFIAENEYKEIIIIDEIDKMPMKDQEGLLTMMERGNFTNTKVRNTKTVKANIVIFATSNSIERLSKPLLSRLTVLAQSCVEKAILMLARRDVNEFTFESILF